MAPPRARQSRRSNGGQRYDGRVTKTVSPGSTKPGTTGANNDPFNLSELTAALPNNNILPSRFIKCPSCDMVFAKTYYISKHQFSHSTKISCNLKTGVVRKLVAEKPKTQACITCQLVFDNEASLREHRFQAQH